MKLGRAVGKKETWFVTVFPKQTKPQHPNDYYGHNNFFLTGCCMG